jgi:hypothetical protein
MRQSPAIIISIIALTLSLGGGAGYAASVATSRPAPVKITWHGLSLRQGWHAAAKGYGAAKPSYTVSNGVVYLTGAASRTNPSLPSIIGVLPRGARPAHVLYLAGFNYAASGGVDFDVFPNGDIEVLGSGGDQSYFTSLAGIEFPLGS